MKTVFQSRQVFLDGRDVWLQIDTIEQNEANSGHK